MRSEEDIQSKMDDLESEKDDLEDEYKEKLEEENVEEGSSEGDKIMGEYEDKKKVIEDQIELLEWVLEE